MARSQGRRFCSFAGALLFVDVCGEPCSSFISSSFQDITSIFSRHSSPKSMLTLADLVAGLKCSLHECPFQLYRSGLLS